LVCCAVGGVEQVREEFVLPALHRGWQVAVTLTPTAAHWLSLDPWTHWLIDLELVD